MMHNYVEVVLYLLYFMQGVTAISVEKIYFVCRLNGTLYCIANSNEIQGPCVVAYTSITNQDLVCAHVATVGGLMPKFDFTQTSNLVCCLKPLRGRKSEI